MIRTRKAPARFLSAMLCLVLMLGLLPMTAFAEGTREEVDTIKATAIINVPSYGEPTNYPTFTVTEGSPAYIATMMTHWEKKNTVTGKWDNVYSGDTFTEGTWRLSVQVRIDGEGGKTHKLSKNPRFFVNEVEWQIVSKPLFDDPHFVSLAYFHSQEYEVTSSTLPQMYDITVTNGVAKNESYIDITKAKPGDKVVLLADDRRDEGLAFEKWVVTGATVDAENNSTAKFVMPEGNVTAEATYIPCDISIKAVKLTLGNYAVGKKASDISVKIITPDVVDFSYGDTYRCYDEDGVALGGSYVLCYLEGETVKRLGADELIKEGVEYFLEVHIKSDEGYTFLGLEEENVTLDGTAGGAMFMRPNNAVYSFLLKPLKTVDLTLDNYAVGNKAGDISVEITTPGVLFSGSGEGSGEYNQGYQIAIPDGEGIDGTITLRILGPDEKLEAGADYYLFVFVKAADGSTLKDLTAANAKLDGKAAEAVDLLSDGVTAVIIFKLTPLEASHTHTVSFNANGGTGTMADVTGVSGEYTLPACTFTAPANKQFKGWATSASGTVITGTSITVSADTKLYAIWELIPVTKPAITTTTLPDGKVGEAYNQTLAATGTNPITWSIETGALPDGLTLVGDTIKGTPSKAGEFKFTVKATNGGGSDTKELTIKIADAETAKYHNVTLTGAGTGATGAGSHAAGTTVNIYAGTKSGYTFNGWTSDDVTILSASSKNASFVMPDKAVTVKANWTYNGGGSGGGGYTYYTIKATAGVNGSISPSGNVSVREGRDQTFTITPDKGYAVAKVLIDSKNVGAVKSYTFENVKKSHTIEVVFMKAGGNPQTGVFVDVATGSYYEDAVDWAVENGITQGTDDTHFSPDGICTRAQAVTFLWRAAGSPAAKSSAMPFTDVKSGSYYYDAVLWAVENGITKGTSATTFSPDQNCSRAQIVTFLWRSEKSPAAGTVNPFTDVKSDAYYADAVLWAVKEDVTKGTTATTFSPDDNCTRAQIVTFIYRALAE